MIAALAGVVGVLRPALHTGHGSGVDDSPPLGRDHVGDHGLRTEKCALHVHIEHPLPFLR